MQLETGQCDTKAVVAIAVRGFELLLSGVFGCLGCTLQALLSCCDVLVPAPAKAGKLQNRTAKPRMPDLTDNLKSNLPGGSDGHIVEESAAEVVASSSRSHTCVHEKDVVGHLMAMGFDEEESCKAARASGNDLEKAVEIVCRAENEDMTAQQSDTIPEHLQTLMDMGFSEAVSRKSLKAHHGDLHAAIEHAAAEVSSASIQLQGANEALTRLEVSLEELRADASETTYDIGSVSKKLRELAEGLTEVSCSLDAINVSGDDVVRRQRRSELQRCDALETIVAELRQIYAGH